MGKTRFCLWGGAAALVLACAVSFGRSSGSDGRPTDAAPCFVRVGAYYINAHRIDYVVRERDGLVVIFGSEAGTRLKLTGLEAQEMQRWLSSASQSPGTPAAKQAQKEAHQPTTDGPPNGSNGLQKGRALGTGGQGLQTEPPRSGGPRPQSR
jgi:hypothetical protein